MVESAKASRQTDLKMTTSPSPGPHVVRFGVYEVDLRAGELRKRGFRIRLPEQPFQLLAILLEHPGEMVTREDLQKRLWPDGTFVDFEQGLNAAVKRLREALGDSAENPRYIETVSRRGYRFIESLTAGPGRIESLAVLPLENLSRDPEQEYFAEGMTEALINTLAKISALRVVSRTTAMRYKKVDKTLPQIARELNVDAVVEGTVLRSGERVRISAQLVQASTDTHLWAETYDEDLRDVLALQAKVARAIANEIQVKLTPLDHARFGRVHTVEPEAYDAYLKGRFFWNKRTGVSIKKSAEFFQLAIEKDANYAAAYAGLADAFVVLGYWGFVAPDEGAGRAKIVALKSLEIDDASAEAHASLAFAMLQYDRNFLGAEKEFKRSIELNPRYATARQWHALCFSVTGRSEEAITEIKRAVELDPVSSIIHVIFAAILGFASRWEEAIGESRRALELDPSVPARWILGWTCLHGGLLERAVSLFQEGVRDSGGAAFFLFGLAHTYALADQREAALRIVQQLKELSEHSYVMPFWIATIYAGLDERDLALLWLERSYEERSAWIVLLKVYPWLNEFRSDPRFDDLLRRMNFPEVLKMPISP